MAQIFNVGFSKFRIAFQYAIELEPEPEKEEQPIAGVSFSIKMPQLEYAHVYECLECGTLTTSPEKHELRYHR